MTISMSDFRSYVVLPASDVERARRWYKEKLGLEHSRAEFGGYWYEFEGGCTIALTPGRFAGPAQSSSAGWIVEDIESVMETLRSRGVVFEEYSQPGLRTQNGLFSLGPMRAAWFKDPEGNILQISEIVLGAKMVKEGEREEVSSDYQDYVPDPREVVIGPEPPPRLAPEAE